RTRLTRPSAPAAGSPVFAPRLLLDRLGLALDIPPRRGLPADSLHSPCRLPVVPNRGGQPVRPAGTTCPSGFRKTRAGVSACLSGVPPGEPPPAQVPLVPGRWARAGRVGCCPCSPPGGDPRPAGAGRNVSLPLFARCSHAQGEDDCRCGEKWRSSRRGGKLGRPGDRTPV